MLIRCSEVPMECLLILCVAPPYFWLARQNLTHRKRFVVPVLLCSCTRVGEDLGLPASRRAPEAPLPGLGSDAG